eukprot:evm.model.scf_887.11 EVM.evm.TU.scf_887.11   scf_887:55709-56653(-)
MPTAGQPFAGAQGPAAFSPIQAALAGAAANANTCPSASALLSALQAQCSRPPVGPAVVPGIGDVMGGGPVGGNMLRNELVRQLLMSVGGAQTSEAMNWLQYLAAAGCGPDGKPPQMNTTTPLGVLPSQFMPEGFK